MDLVKVLYQWKKGKSKKKKPFLLGIYTLVLWNRSLRLELPQLPSHSKLSLIFDKWLRLTRTEKSLVSWPPYCTSVLLTSRSATGWLVIKMMMVIASAWNLFVAPQSCCRHDSTFFTETCIFDELSRLQTKLLVPRSLPFSSSAIILIQSYFIFSRIFS